jgi:hypothetical protein
MIRRNCRECGRSFTPKKAYYHTCSRCYFDGGEHSERRAEPGPHSADPIATELSAHLPLLIQLAHPDRHGGSQAATRATQWLLAMRKRLTGAT